MLSIGIPYPVSRTVARMETVGQRIRKRHPEHVSPARPARAFSFLRRSTNKLGLPIDIQLGLPYSLPHRINERGTR
jgi:hypothetical protein